MTARFTIAAPPDFRYAPTVLSHGWGALAPFSYADGVLSRVQKLSDGQIVRFDLRWERGKLVAHSASDLTARQQREIGEIAARCLSFDYDLAPFHDLIRAHPTYGWIETVGAGRMLISPSVWEDLAKTLLTTNTTWAMTIGMVNRLAALGDLAPNGVDQAFPEPEQIAAFDSEALNAQVRAGYRGAYLHTLATRIASGELDVELWRDPEIPSVEVYKALKGIKGFGDYAAGALMRLLGRFDQLGLDSACRTMYAQRYNNGAKATDKEIAAYYAPFGDWKGLVVWMDVMKAYMQ
ncbi:MAG TPA: hypothetical protein VHD90_00855, partial [Phototrophicaceae bacterium]|nr:hypothetical protein [Phototrophicaceae bacterium]